MICLIRSLRLLKFNVSVMYMSFEKFNSGIKAFVRQLGLLIVVLIVIGVNCKLILCVNLFFQKVIYFSKKYFFLSCFFFKWCCSGHIWMDFPNLDEILYKKGFLVAVHYQQRRQHCWCAWSVPNAPSQISTGERDNRHDCFPCHNNASVSKLPRAEGVDPSI